MLHMKTKTCLVTTFLLFVVVVVTASAQTAVNIKLNVDATQASRNVLRTRLTIPVKPGPLTLFYPKWIPGEHTPTGPINDMAGFKLSGAGKSIAWRRDDVEMFAFHCEIPQGVTALDVMFDDV